MDITISKSAGFCFGVKKAVDSVYEAIETGENITILGELIHNRQVNDDLKRHGVVTIDDVSQCSGRELLVIRTHGVGEAVIENAQKNAARVLDLTCPYVKKIHELVRLHSRSGYSVVIVGDAAHPEVLGVKGWCDVSSEVYVINSEPDAQNIVSDKVCVVAQTTINNKKYENIINIIKTNCQEALIFDTICKSTRTRQQEAEKISSESDIMLVIGGKDSSNTRKLYEICKVGCAETYHIENFEDIPQNIKYQNKKIGITAGASTPIGIIEEVTSKMEENNVVENAVVENAETQSAETGSAAVETAEARSIDEMSFEEAMEQTLKTLNTGDVVVGIVVEVRPTEVIVDLGFKSDGIIMASELADDPDVKPSDVVKVGEEITVFVVGVNDHEGKTVLSKKKLDSIAGWKKIEDSLENQTILSGKVVQIVNGGMLVSVHGSRVFVHASQASDRFVEDLEVFMGQTVELRITEINPRRRRLAGSVRSVLTETKKAASEKFWADAEVGKKYTGAVKSIMPFGAFVDLGGIDGLVHISELSWNRIKSPAEVVKVGDVLEVYIKELDPEKKKISLGYKKTEDNPWAVAQSKFNVGDIVKCKVVRFMTFGAFVELIPGVDGLIHISQIANRRIGKPADELEIGQEIEAKITEVNWETRRISLSIRALLPVEEGMAESAEIVEAVAEAAAEENSDASVEE